MKEAVIFDMDGLMIDSERVTYEEYKRKLDLLGYHDFTVSSKNENVLKIIKH